MAKKEEYTVNNIYQGGYSSLEPGYGDIFTGYHVSSSQLGAPTKPDTANQIAQVNMLLNQGIIPIEMGALNPEVFDQIPKQHFKEINRMAKLTGSDISVHAPIIEASGIDEHGWNESARQLAENQLKEVIDRTSPMNEKGGMSVTIHGAGKIYGAEYQMTPEGKKESGIYVVNRETGKITTVLTGTTQVTPESKNLQKGDIFSPRDELGSLNRTEWENTLSKLMHDKVDADARIDAGSSVIPSESLKEIAKDPNKARFLYPEQVQAYNNLIAAQQFLGDSNRVLNSMFDKAYRFGTDEDRAKLTELSERYKKQVEKFQHEPDLQKALKTKSGAIQELIVNLKEVQPQIYQPIEDFALDKSSETFANVALHAFQNYKDKAPTINVENLFPGMAFSHGKELRALIETSREKFVKKAVAQGYSKSQAEKDAERIIGVTLDVGHLNIAKKKGFKDEDLIKEVNEIAKFVKHVHLTDNFGYSDSHLPPGMGNVPIKEILERLEKEGYEGKKIVEAGAFVQHFGTSPFPVALEALGSPMFSYGETPYWNQAIGLQQGYSGGFGEMLPQVNYETFGGGFSQLPLELGGQRPGAKGARMSGKPME